MIVYLDQNKWIELARIANGIEKSHDKRVILEKIYQSRELGYVYPLSATHYLEFSRIKNTERRKKLGKFMWDLSQGYTFVSNREIVLYELEVVLNQLFPNIQPMKLNLIGKGFGHAFGQKFEISFPKHFEEMYEKSLLEGNDLLGIEPIFGVSNTYRENFRIHLEKLPTIKSELEKSKWNDMLYASQVMDITEPINEVIEKHNVAVKAIFNQREFLTNLVDSMPSRKLDFHLRKQVLKNTSYKAKLSDLEDWAGLGVACCYCDIVVCEKPFASLVQKDKFITSARIETKIENIFN